MYALHFSRRSAFHFRSSFSFQCKHLRVNLSPIHSASYHPHWLIHARILSSWSLLWARFTLTLYCSNCDAYNTDSVPNCGKSPRTWCRRVSFSINNPELQWSLREFVKDLLNSSMQYSRCASCLSLQSLATASSLHSQHQLGIEDGYIFQRSISHSSTTLIDKSRWKRETHIQFSIVLFTSSIPRTLSPTNRQLPWVFFTFWKINLEAVRVVLFLNRWRCVVTCFAIEYFPKSRAVFICDSGLSRFVHKLTYEICRIGHSFTNFDIPRQRLYRDSNIDIEI